MHNPFIPFSLHWSIVDKTNLEFTTIGETSITFWRINSSDGSLQYQIMDFLIETEYYIKFSDIMIKLGGK